jgi:hypothetical protein
VSQVLAQKGTKLRTDCCRNSGWSQAVTEILNQGTPLEDHWVGQWEESNDQSNPGSEQTVTGTPGGGKRSLKY